MIAYYFPPDGSAGVYRPLRFIRELPARGWLPTVVTVDGGTHERYDPQLLQAVPEAVEVVRVPVRDLWQTIQTTRAKRFRARIQDAAPEQVARVNRSHQRPLRRWARQFVRTIEASVYYPDHARFWIAAATEATVALCRTKHPSAMIVTGGPWSTFLVAHKAFKRTGVPYVLDFRDSWTLTCNDEFEARRPGWAVRRDRRVLDRLFRDARAVIFRYEMEAEAYWRAYPGALTPNQIHIIPNGYEGEVESFHAAAGDRCVVLYTGTVTPYKCDTFLEALSLLQSEHPAAARQLRVVFVGEGGEAVSDAVLSHGLDRIVETMQPVPSREVARLQREAHALLLLGVKPYQGYELCGSKVFGYLKAGRPILGVLPMDESRRVLERVGVSTIADIDDPRAIAAMLKELLASWSADRLSALLPDAEACRWYSSETQTLALVRALEGRPPVSQFRSGAVDIPDSLLGKIGEHGWLDPCR